MPKVRQANAVFFGDSFSSSFERMAWIKNLGNTKPAIIPETQIMLNIIDLLQNSNLALSYHIFMTAARIYENGRDSAPYASKETDWLIPALYIQREFLCHNSRRKNACFPIWADVRSSLRISPIRYAQQISFPLLILFTFSLFSIAFIILFMAMYHL